MNERTLYKLEFHKIIEMLKTHALTESGKQSIEKLIPSSNYKEVFKWQKETTDALNMVVKKGRVPIRNVKEITTSLKRVEIGAVLSSHEILNIAKVMESCRRLKNYYKEDAETVNYEYIKGYFESLSTHNNVENEINRCILAPDEYADEATPALGQIRRQMKSATTKIRETLQNVLHSSQYQDMLQEPVITMRQDRYCIPIKIEYKNAFKGIIHDQSSTGATAFIEPLSVVELGNNLRTLEAKEQEEIEKILAYLTELIGENSILLSTSFQTMTMIDVIFAKSEYALKIDGREPKLNTEGKINLKGARHPMLPKESVVPIDVYVGDKFTTLLITGPNTGGKTVTLKTLGLFTLMAQAGLQIPVKEGSHIAVFDDVFADLGDEQSIEQNLSTFSSHMTNIVSILKNMTTNSLVLMDEVGSGTDPLEGAALAMSILEHLRKQHIRTVATTHYSELKLYAMSTEGVENASCEFDVEFLRPTYKLFIGIPGKSNAFAISQQLGLENHLIEDAKVFLTKENVKMEDILVELEYSKRMADIEKEKAEGFRKEAEYFRENIKKERDKLEKSKQRILDRANEKAQELLKKVEEEADGVLKEVRQAARAVQVVIDEKGLHNAKEQMKTRLGKQHQNVNKTLGTKKAPQKTIKTIKLGDQVMVTNLMQKGIILELPDSSGKALVQVGILPIKVHKNNLECVEDEVKVVKPKKTQRPTGGVSHNIKKSSAIRMEVDVRGLMVDEALPVVDKYLDDAYLSGLKQATIIHGKGTGALREAISQMLRRHPHIATFRPGKYGEGEMGVTIVEIK
ncbi:MAG: endonuclease MutS2 [Cellulosilyticaceae bacterium]